MTWTTRETTARKNLGVGVNWTFDRVLDMTHDAYSALSELFVRGLYYVDEENGASGNAGTAPDAAFNTIALAAAACDADYDDDALYYTFVAPGNYSEDDILFAGHGWHLIGVGIPGRDSGVHIVAPDNSSAYGILAFAGANCEVANVCAEIATNAQPVLYLVAADNCWIHDNAFYSDAVPTNVCVVEAHDIRNSVIERNFFFGGLTYGWYSITGADKYLIETRIRDNVFSKSSVGGFGSGAKGIYIHADTVGYGTVIENNKVLMGEVAGSPIGIDDNCATTTGIMIIDNYVAVPSGKTPIETAAGVMLHNHTWASTSAIVDPNPAAS